MQKVDDVHDTDNRLTWARSAGRDHVVPESVSAFPSLSTAAQNVAVGHATDWRAAPLSIWVGTQFVPL